MLSNKCYSMTSKEKFISPPCPYNELMSFQFSVSEFWWVFSQEMEEFWISLRDKYRLHISDLSYISRISLLGRRTMIRATCGLGRRTSLRSSLDFSAPDPFRTWACTGFPRFGLTQLRHWEDVWLWREIFCLEIASRDEFLCGSGRTLASMQCSGKALRSFKIPCGPQKVSNFMRTQTGHHNCGNFSFTFHICRWFKENFKLILFWEHKSSFRMSCQIS